MLSYVQKSKQTTSPPHLHIPPPSNRDRLPINITHQRTAHGQHRTRRLRRCARPPQWDIQKGFLLTSSSLLRLRYAECDFLAIWRSNKSTSFLCGCQACEDVAESDGVGADAELGTPSGEVVSTSLGLENPGGRREMEGKDINILLSNRLRHPRNPRLRQRIINLPRIPIKSTRTANIHNDSILSIFHPKVRRRRPDDLERSSAVQVHDGVPLLVRHLVDHPVPRVPRIVDDDVDLAVAKLCGFLDERLDVGVVEDVAGDGDGGAAGRGYGGGYVLCFLWGGC